MCVLELYLIFLLVSYNPSTLLVFESQPRSGQEHSQAFNPLLCIFCPSTVDTGILLIGGLKDVEGEYEI